MWVYLRESGMNEQGVREVWWEVGFYHNGNFVGVSQFPEERLAKAEVHYLNGGN